MQMPSFMIPAGETSIASPQEVERKRLIALALMRQGMDTGPTDMWGGVARLGQSVVGALMNKKADRQEQAGRDDANKNFTAIMERLMGPSSAGVAPAGGDFGAEVQPSPYEAQGIPDPRSPEFNVIDDRQLPVDPNMIQAQPQGQPAQQIAQPQGGEFAQMDQLPMGEIIGLLNNPYLQPGQAQILQMFVKDKFDKGSWSNLGDGRILNNSTGEIKEIGQRVDPLDEQYKLAQIAKLQAEVEQIGQVDPYEAEKRVLEIEKLKQELNKTETAAATQANTRATITDTVLGAANKARKLAEQTGTTGTLGQIASYWSESDAAEVYRQVDVLKSQASIQNLTAMRRESPTGGALGAVSDKENKMLADAAGALDPSAGPQRFREALDNYELTLFRIVHGYEAGTQLFQQTRAGGGASTPAAPNEGGSNLKQKYGLE